MQGSRGFLQYSLWSGSIRMGMTSVHYQVQPTLDELCCSRHGQETDDPLALSVLLLFQCVYNISLHFYSVPSNSQVVPLSHSFTVNATLTNVQPAVERPSDYWTLACHICAPTYSPTPAPLTELDGTVPFLLILNGLVFIFIYSCIQYKMDYL